MPTWTQRLLAALAFALIFAWAWQGLFEADPLGPDYVRWAELAREARAGRPWSASGTELPVAQASAQLSLFLWGEAGEHPLRAVFPARLENLGLWLLAALGLCWFVRRIFAPWIGAEQAASGGWCAACALAVHPLAFGAVVSIEGRGLALALAFGSLACAAFLKGRQEYRMGWLVLAATLVLAAALSHTIGLGLGILLAAAEYLSGRRYRPFLQRIRTAASTLFGFSALAVLAFLAAPSGGAGGARALLDEVAARGTLGLAWGLTEKLGLLVLPVGAESLSLFGQGIAALILVIVLQPALLAARSAPRLWTGLLATVFGCLIGALMSEPRHAASSRDLTHSAALLPAAWVFCAGLGVAATALAGTRRWLAPAALCIGFAFLAQANSLIWVHGGRAVAWLRSDLAAAALAHGRAARFVVLDPPRRVLDIDPLGAGLPALLDPAFEPSAKRADEVGSVRGLELRALAAFVESSEFDAALQRTLVLLTPRASQPADRLPLGARVRDAWALTAGSSPPPTATRTWYRDGRSPNLDLDPRDQRALLVRVGSQAQVDRPPRMAWRLKGEEGLEGGHEGRWIQRDGEWTAVFDLASSLDWLVAERIARVWSTEGWATMVEASFAVQISQLVDETGMEHAPSFEAGAWTFAAPLEFAEEAAEFELTLLDPQTLASRSLRCIRGAGGRLQSERFVRTDLDFPSGELVWSLESRLDGRSIARSRGRIGIEH